MPVKYIPYVPNTIEGQAILDNITRTRRILRYADNGKVYAHLRRGLPLYEMVETEAVGGETSNLLLRGECLSACAYLKDQGIALDLVYIDPPFASGADYAKSVYLRRNPHQAEALAQAEAELELDELRAFEEKMYGDIWNKEDYLNWMFENLTAIKSVMSETASIYVHLDQHIGHYVKVLMDEVFGENNFQREIVWDIQVLSGFKTIAQNWIRGHDVIFYYTKNEREKTQEVPLPKDWTFLIHGSNLNRKEWKDDNIIQLDVGILTIKGMGLSAVSKKEKDEDEKGYQELREKGLALGTYDTTAGYSSGEGMALEIRVLFPSFHSRSTTLS